MVDVVAYEYVRNISKVSELESMKIDDSNNYNISLRKAKTFNKSHTFVLDDLSGYDDENHHFIKRYYNGTMHDTDSSVRFTKKINTNIIMDMSISDNDHLYIVEDFSILKSKDDHMKIVIDKMNNILTKFSDGEIAPENFEDIPTFTKELNIDYIIGNVSVFIDKSQENSVKYYVCIPYISRGSYE